MFAAGLLISTLVRAEPSPEPAANGAARPLFHRVDGNLLQNSSFEHNWFNHAFAERRRFLLLQASDMGVGECDGNIDYWTTRGKVKTSTWDATAAHSGSRSIRFDGPGSASQLVRFTGENSPRAGGAYYAYFMPMEKTLAWQVLRRTVTVGAWCRTQDVPVGAEPKLTLKLECGARGRLEELASQVTFGKKIVTRTVSAAPKTHDWQYVEAKIDAGELESAPWYATVTVSSGGKGTAWFDDVSCVETAASGLVNRPPSIDGPAAQAAAAELVNRLPNGGFESLDESGWARGWKKPALWTWFRNDYYSFTGWSHSDSKSFRGSAVVDRMISWSGNASLRMNVFPGDNFAVESDAIALNQDKARPIEVRAMVKADNLRTLEIMGRDERGGWVRQGDFLGDDMQEPGAYNMATTGAGTFDWVCVRKFFSPDHPIKTLTLSLAARGFDGQIVADKDIVGTVWIDDVQVFEHGIDKGKIAAASAPPAVPDAPAAFAFKVADIDLGQRLWGKNAVALTIEFHGRDLEQIKSTLLQVTLTDPRGKASTSTGKFVITRYPAGSEGMGVATIRAEYPIDALCASWHEQFKLSLQFFAAGQPLAPPADFFFGTPASILTSGVSGFYFYRDEKPFVYANVNVSSDSLKDLGRCQIVVNSGGKEKAVLDLAELTAIGEAQAAPDYINTRNMVRTEIASKGFTVHPWNDPQRDNVVRARLFNKVAGKETLVAESVPVSFGFLDALPPHVTEKIERTAVNDKGFITINGKPYFPVYWRPHGDSKAPEANYPVKELGYKAVDLTTVIYSKNAPPDADVKAALLARVNAVKNDPAFFQYEIGEGEMQLQGKEWVERLEWCKTAIGWIREADPNHLINGPISWLVGHPGHNAALKSFLNSWDVIGVELSFESPVQVNKIARPLMTQRQSAVIVGLEAYFYQPLEVLRWRGYRAVVDGAHGIGLCPSGMLESRPDSVNYLRGLNAEFRALSPAIMGDEPAQKCSADSERIDLMERTTDGKRFLIALRNKDNAGPITARFTLPAGISCKNVKVLFEGRDIHPSGGGFSDEFATPYSVHVYELE